MPVKNIADRAPAFNVYAETAYGNDLFEVIAAARRGIEQARSGRGPALIEFKTFRRRGHGEHDDCGYVPKELREFWEARDPLVMYRRWLVERAKINQGMLIRIDEVAARQIEEAEKFAESLPFPKPETVGDRLFAPSPHDPKPEDRRRVLEPIENPAVPALMETKGRTTGEHF
jgi:TPP-dependent pyruvate/acetoin dehydrogenase alpha subunit